MKCRSGKHEWMDPDSAALCCNGYHRVLRLAGQEYPDEHPKGKSYCEGMMVFVWLPKATEGD